MVAWSFSDRFDLYISFLTLIQSMRERGMVMRMRMTLTPVNRREHGPGLVGSASKKWLNNCSVQKCYPEMI